MTPLLHGSGRSLVYFNSNPKLDEHRVQVHHPDSHRFAVTISSQTGSGAIEIAQRLATRLQVTAPSVAPWKVFDKSIMIKVLEDHHLPTRLARFLPEDATGVLDDVLDELFGLHPPSLLIVQKSIETILKLVNAGNVILVGWGANVITSKSPNVFHVRLVGSLERRLQRIAQRDHLSRKEALALITRQDRGRERYVKKYFGQQLSDTLLYHLILNTDRFSDEEAAQLICLTARNTRHLLASEGLEFAPAA